MNELEIVRLRNAVNERDHAAGSQTAPVALLEYGNFECIQCGRAYPVIKEIQQLLGDDLRFVFRNFPTVRAHPHAVRAAEAAESAAAQEKFWEMYDELFTHQQALEEHDLSLYAKRIGLDVERFGRDMAEHSFLKKIEAEYQSALFEEHVTGTPTLYINEVRYTGATDVDSLLLAIKQTDTEGRIRFPERAKGVRGLLDRLHSGVKR
jgi:protein-disulfide isomerase